MDKRAIISLYNNVHYMNKFNASTYYPGISDTYDKY